MAQPIDDLIVTKASGEKVRFSVGKLRMSLLKSGADDQLVQDVLRQLEPLLYEGISTKKIYKKAFSILKKLSKKTAAKYSLKQGIMQLGPSGFPFEKFVAELLKAQGYATEIGVMVDGHCVRHEIDVIAAKDGHRSMIECKYHNLHRNKSDVKIPMYIQSRFKDVEKVWPSEKEFEIRFHEVWLVTNTRFTDDAKRYAACMNMRLIGWDFPSKSGLKDMVDSFHLYPITCLTSLTQSEKQRLLDQKIVMCKELLDNESILRKAGVRDSRLLSALTEVDSLCGL
ncbi:restriction endonuclease [Pontibacter sp. JH31]|uniref:Restriction endonuclease n=1 Tax=Pontibacter aquaedesilientis TaxID=2766980 RepID=A0ABR7XER9_9BACT|nr:restriction endonuclease [Pontibacter aquaedesilientis]MBD1396406.1 restriction endonuclease [Pontibacter aquaedesilientis]